MQSRRRRGGAALRRTLSSIALILIVWSAPHRLFADRSGTKTLDIAVAGMSCEGCAANITKTVTALDGVVSVRADHEKARVVVVYEPAKVSDKRIRSAITKIGCVIGDKDPPVVYPKGADVKTISKKGEDVRVERHLARGKITIVDFYADWCKPCKALDRRIAARVAAAPETIAVRKVNIVTWESPVAKRYLKKVPGLPYVHVYDQKGKLVVKLSQDNVDKLDHYLAKLSRADK